MRDIMVLTKDASKITARKEHAAGPVVSLDAGFLSKMRADHVHFDSLSTYQAVTGLFITVDRAQPRAKIAVSKMGVRKRAFPRDLHRRDELIARRVGIKQERRSKMQPTTGGRKRERQPRASTKRSRPEHSRESGSH